MDRVYTYQEIQNLVSPVMRKYWVSRAYLFGSYSRGEATPESEKEDEGLIYEEGYD